MKRIIITEGTFNQLTFRAITDKLKEEGLLDGVYDPQEILTNLRKYFYHYPRRNGTEGLGQGDFVKLYKEPGYQKNAGAEQNTVKPFSSRTPATGVSENGALFIAQHENTNGMKRFANSLDVPMTSAELNGYGNDRGHKTYGYGLLRHPNGKFMDEVKATYTQPELKQLYLQKLNLTASEVLNRLRKTHGNIALGQNQIDAIVSACYNFGVSGFISRMGALIGKNPNNPQIPEIWAKLSDAQAARGYGGLAKRRRKEANLYAQDIPNYTQQNNNVA